MRTPKRNQIRLTNPLCFDELISSTAQGFTRLDLLATLAALGLLFLIVLPAIARPGQNSKVVQCLNNNRQLQNAWRMYADDNNDMLVYASASGSATLPTSPGYYAWATAVKDFNPGNRANLDPTVDIQKRPLWPYNMNASIYRCPADEVTLNVSGFGPRPHIRSMAMNLYCGGFAPTDTGAGLNGISGGLFSTTWRIFSKFSAINLPSMIFVFQDERPDELSIGNFMTKMDGYPIPPLLTLPNPNLYSFSGLPGMYHDRAASFSFADGHTEIKKWLDSRTTPPVVSGISVNDTFPSRNNQDIAWLQSHATTPK